LSPGCAGRPRVPPAALARTRGALRHERGRDGAEPSLTALPTGADHGAVVRSTATPSPGAGGEPSPVASATRHGFLSRGTALQSRIGDASGPPPAASGESWARSIRGRRTNADLESGEEVADSRDLEDSHDPCVGTDNVKVLPAASAPFIIRFSASTRRQPTGLWQDRCRRVLGIRATPARTAVTTERGSAIRPPRAAVAAGVRGHLRHMIAAGVSRDIPHLAASSPMLVRSAGWSPVHRLTARRDPALARRPNPPTWTRPRRRPHPSDRSLWRFSRPA
jgi:hypothetical protein